MVAVWLSHYTLLSRATGGGRSSKEEKSVSKAFPGIFHQLLRISHWPQFSGGLPSLQEVWERVVSGSAFIVEEGKGREDWNGCRMRPFLDLPKTVYGLNSVSPLSLS